MNRRLFITQFLLGTAFTILPGAGRIWRAERKPPRGAFLNSQIVPYWYQTYRCTRYISPAYVAAYNRLLRENPDFRNLVFEDCVRDSSNLSTIILHAH